ncbi:hypothetical protein DFP72DRAFT_1066708 [Ephemerocybe angulata]|uniref:Fe2OG dioxygenase domain-containing protein n=1 Tax=Ephemerocybe angulata TaxID=980116 RepID=A0A8H6I2R6_9AGAR|nr:hypothetical protein DFP72DRAFT_1066708 [Tulosesus angulatus]
MDVDDDSRIDLDPGPPEEKIVAGAPDAQLEEDLNSDLLAALSGDFEYLGNFYDWIVDSWPVVPDPELTIEGVGRVDLPLTEECAKAVIARAVQAPYGKGELTVVDTTVRDTWAIEPSSIVFENAEWAKYIANTVTPQVWKALGVAAPICNARCELYKLLLYQTGSHFLPHQDTCKSDGMFATVVIVLPSDFEGGEVHLSHAGESAILDVAEDAGECKTSILAWYTDVIHEVKPVTSGYRLALSYNLINDTQSSDPLPTVPSMDKATERLRSVLQKWREGGYSKEPSVPFLAYMLSYMYSANDLARGVPALKGSDAHLVRYLLPVAEDLGFSVFLANLQRVVKGTVDNPESGNDHEIAHNYREEQEIYHLTRISDGPPLKVGSFEVPNDVLVPKNEFEESEPDYEDYEGYTGNEGGDLEQRYDRSVLILFHKEDQTKVIYAVKGAEWALDHLHSTSLELNADFLVAAVFEEMKGPGYLPRKRYAETLLAWAVDTKDPDLWNRAMPWATSGIINIEKPIALFGLDAIRPGLTFHAVSDKERGEHRTLGWTMRRIKEYNSLAGEAGPPTWIEDLKREAVSSFAHPSMDDIEAIVLLAQDCGLQVLADTIIPRIKRSIFLADEFRFYKTLYDKLQKSRDLLLKGSTALDGGDAHPTPSASYELALFLCFEEASKALVAHYSKFLPFPQYAGPLIGMTDKTGAEHALNNIRFVIESSFAMARLEPCTRLLSSLLDIPREPASRTPQRITFLIPLVASLKEIAGKHGMDCFLQDPFASFLRDMTSLYLSRMLSGRDDRPSLPLMSISNEYGSDRTKVDAFINDPWQEEWVFTSLTESWAASRAKNPDKWCFEGGPYGAAKLNTLLSAKSEMTSRLKKHYTVTITKTPLFMEAYSWETRLAAAKAFLDTIGDEEGLKRLMGERYDDVLKAMDGTQAFIYTAGEKESTV